MLYRVERTRWIPTKRLEDDRAELGYDEIYYEEIEADYYSVSNDKVLNFYNNTHNMQPSSNSLFYTYKVELVASYADGKWESVRKV